MSDYYDIISDISSLQGRKSTYYSKISSLESKIDRYESARESLNTIISAHDSMMQSSAMSGFCSAAEIELISAEELSEASASELKGLESSNCLDEFANHLYQIRLRIETCGRSIMGYSNKIYDINREIDSLQEELGNL